MRNPMGIRPCTHCGKDVEVYHNKRLLAEKIYCNRDCMAQGLRKDSILNCTCDTCGKQYHLKPYKMNLYKNHFCSMKCMAKFKTINFCGEDNHQYGLKGELNASFKSNEKITNYGYKKIRCLDHPFKDINGFVFEHRLVAEQHLLNDSNTIFVDNKPYLKSGFDVHHKDKDRLNNKVENLEVLTHSDHMKLHHRDSGVLIQLICKHCNVNFYSKNKHKQFCSQSCQLEFKKEFKKKDYKLCKHCQSEFHPLRSNQQYCTIQCYNASHNYSSTVVKCSYCGVDFKIKSSRLQKSQSGKAFCKRECHMKYNRQHKERDEKGRFKNEYNKNQIF